MGSEPAVCGTGVKIPVNAATDKVIYLVCSTIVSGATVTMRESSNNTNYTVPVGKVLKIVKYCINWGHTNCATNLVYFSTSGGTQINCFDGYHTNANAYWQEVDGYTEVAAGNTVQFQDVSCGSTAQVLGVETDV